MQQVERQKTREFVLRERAFQSFFFQFSLNEVRRKISTVSILVYNKLAASTELSVDVESARLNDQTNSRSNVSTIKVKFPSQAKNKSKL